MNAINWATAPTESVLPGVTRQVLNGENQTMVRYVYQPGSVFPIHQHPQEQITLVLTGEIEFTIDGVVSTLRTGDASVIPGNTPHGARVIGNLAVETINTLSPRREMNPVLKIS